MKKNVLFMVLLLLYTMAQAQNTGIGTTAPLAKLHVYQGASGATPFVFSPLVVERNGHTYINLLSPAANETAILFGQPAHSAHGVIMYNHELTPNGFQFRTNGNITRMVINQFGYVGIGLSNPQMQLDVAGSTKTNKLFLALGGSNNDFLIKQNVQGEVGFSKGYMALGLRYIICINGNFPNQGGPTPTPPYTGEIKLFAGEFVPSGWALCEGQLLLVKNFEILFAIIGTIYGGDGETDFALPNLRNAVPVHAPSSPADSDWQIGQRSAN